MSPFIATVCGRFWNRQITRSYTKTGACRATFRFPAIMTATDERILQFGATARFSCSASAQINRALFNSVRAATFRWLRLLFSKNQGELLIKTVFGVWKICDGIFRLLSLLMFFRNFCRHGWSFTRLSSRLCIWETSRRALWALLA